MTSMASTLDGAAWRRFAARLGLPGLLALALVGAGAWAWSQASDDDHEIERLEHACDELTAKSHAARAAGLRTDAPMHDGRRRGGSSIDGGDTRPEAMRTADMSALLDAAGRNGLQVGSVRYQWVTPITSAAPTAAAAPAGARSPAGNPGGASGPAPLVFARERAEITMTGSYAAFRAWLEEALSAQPALGVAAMHLHRKDSTTSALDIEVAVDFGYGVRDAAEHRAQDATGASR